MRIVFLQFAGDYQEAFHRLAQKGEETYYAQRYSVNYVAKLARRHEFVGTICLRSHATYVNELAPGLYSAGFDASLTALPDLRGAVRLLEIWRPTHVVLRTPITKILLWCVQRGVAVLPVLADSFNTPNLRSRFRHWRLARALNELSVVANHNVPACLSLKRIGVDPSKLVPWDWPQTHTPDQFPVKALSGGIPQILYVGTVTAHKGVEDLIRAAALLRFPFNLHIIGDGEDRALMEAVASRLGIAKAVTFCGAQPHHKVMFALQHASLAVVPSRHSYPEGLPLTLYEALATRTPVVVSDHPVFDHHFKEYQFRFKAGDRYSLAERISVLLCNKDCYADSSAQTSLYWRALQGSVEWATLIDAWLCGDGEKFRMPEAIH